MRPNILLAVEVPEDFPQHTERLGYTAEELIWQLADDLYSLFIVSIST